LNKNGSALELESQEFPPSDREFLLQRGFQRKTPVAVNNRGLLFISRHAAPYQILNASESARGDDEAPTAMMLAPQSLSEFRSCKEAPAAMMKRLRR
jgi:hypothetical protein